MFLDFVLFLLTVSRRDFLYMLCVYLCVLFMLLLLLLFKCVLLFFSSFQEFLLAFLSRCFYVFLKDTDFSNVFLR